MNLRLADLGTYLYLGLVTLGTFSYQERYIFICGAGISSYIYKPMVGMGLAALGPEKYTGQTALGTKMYPGQAAPWAQTGAQVRQLPIHGACRL